MHIVSTPFFPLYMSAFSFSSLKWRGRFVWSYGQSQKSKPVPFPGMAVNTVYSEEIHPHTLWMTLGASVHWRRFWQPRAGSSKILLNMEAHAVLAERQRSNTLSKARLREGRGKKAHAYSQKQPIVSHLSLANWQKQHKIYLLRISILRKLLPYMLQVTYTTHDSWPRAVSQKHTGLSGALPPKRCPFF